MCCDSGESEVGSRSGASGWRKGPVDFAIAVGKFLDRDEDVFTVFNDIGDAYVHSYALSLLSLCVISL